jgi:hypothetical protein
MTWDRWVWPLATGQRSADSLRPGGGEPLA